jgi:hypothetical protein
VLGDGGSGGSSVAQQHDDALSRSGPPAAGPREDAVVGRLAALGAELTTAPAAEYRAATRARLVAMAAVRPVPAEAADGAPTPGPATVLSDGGGVPAGPPARDAAPPAAPGGPPAAVPRAAGEGPPGAGEVPPGGGNSSLGGPAPPRPAGGGPGRDGVGLPVCASALGLPVPC